MLFRSRVVISSPVALGNFHRRQIAIEQRAPADFGERIGLELDAAVRMLNCFVLVSQGLIQSEPDGHLRSN